MFDARDITVVYGDACGDCVGTVRDAGETTTCPRCGSVVACAGVDVDVGEGEVVGVVGESGSGKSSLAEVLALEREATDGTVAYEGYDGNLLDATYAERASLTNGRIGLVHQHVRDGLDLDRTGGGNVARSLLSAGWRDYERVRERVRELFAATEVPHDRIDDAVRSYSGGMQRRVQIAAAIATGPDVVVLDEPTSGLDVSVQARVLDTFRRLQRETGLATVVVSHDLGVIRLLADRTLVMHQGRIIERGLTDRVLEDPHYEHTQVLINSEI